MRPIPSPNNFSPDNSNNLPVYPVPRQDKAKAEPVSLSMTPWYNEQLRTLADTNSISKSAMAQHIIEDYAALHAFSAAGGQIYLVPPEPNAPVVRFELYNNSVNHL